MTALTEEEREALVAERGWSPTTWKRINAKFEVSPGGCWNFTGSLTNGYGYIHTGPGRNRRGGAHRVMWELTNGPVPDALHLDHLCRNRQCINPDHLESVTPGENTLRGDALNFVRNGDMCRNSLHPWPESAYVRSDGFLRCRECARECDRRLKERRVLQGEMQELRDRLAAHEAREAELTAALEAGDACGAVGCRALAERDALLEREARVRALTATFTRYAEERAALAPVGATGRLDAMERREASTWARAAGMLLTALDGGPE